MKFEPIEVIDNPFYFGIGGLGDFLLLMATFYDNILPNTDVIFVCNNVNAIRGMSAMFPKVNRFWFYPIAALNRTPDMWRLIKRHHLCMGTGVTPKEFKYVEDWIECGKSNVFDYYGVKRYPDWAKPIIDKKEKHICIQPFGGSEDKTKKKEIPIYDLDGIIVKSNMNCTPIYLIGSEKDREKYHPVLDWLTKFEDSFDSIVNCKEFIGCDTWGKTLAGLAGKKVTIYPNQYEVGRGPMELFNHPIDPGNYVFLLNWGFEFCTV